jgi:CheY-like chemotaxis protein
LDIGPNSATCWGGSMQAGASPPRGSLHILVVDDNQDSADSLAILLRLWGHTVDVAYCGRTGLALAQIFEPEAVILDISMPGMHGGQVAATLRAQAAFAKTLIIAASAHSLDDTRLDGDRQHFNAFIGKPYNLSDLENLLAAHVATGKS